MANMRLFQELWMHQKRAERIFQKTPKMNAFVQGNLLRKRMVATKGLKTVC